MTRVPIPLLLALLALTTTVAPALAKRDATPRERSAIIRAYLGNRSDPEGHTLRSHLWRHGVVDMSTVDSQYAGMFWTSARGVQASSVIMRQQPGKPWRLLKIYVPMHPCGDYIELVLMDLAGHCHATPTTFPRIVHSTLPQQRVQCPNSHYWDRYHVERIYLLRNLAPGRTTCKQVSREIQTRDSPWVRGDRQPLNWSDTYTSQDGRIVAATLATT